MEANISFSSSGLNPRITVEMPSVKDGLLTSETNFDRSQKKTETMSAPTEAISIHSLCSDSLYHNEQNVEPPRPHVRYKRRNSAVASMLFPSTIATATSFSALRTPASSVASLGLSADLCLLDPVEALAKAQKLLQNIPDYPPPFQPETLADTKKRKSVP